MAGTEYKVNFSIDHLSMANQNRIFHQLLKILHRDERENLHITVTDDVGGKHFIWDGYGEDPDGVRCKECRTIDCDGCALWEARSKNNGKSDNNTGNDTRDK